jgi:hypothetical protein
VHKMASRRLHHHPPPRYRYPPRHQQAKQNQAKRHQQRRVEQQQQQQVNQQQQQQDSSSSNSAPPQDSSSSNSNSAPPQQQGIKQLKNNDKRYDDSVSRQYDRSRIEQELDAFYNYTHDPLLSSINSFYDAFGNDHDNDSVLMESYNLDQDHDSHNHVRSHSHVLDSFSEFDSIRDHCDNDTFSLSLEIDQEEKLEGENPYQYRKKEEQNEDDNDHEDDNENIDNIDHIDKNGVGEQKQQDQDQNEPPSSPPQTCPQAEVPLIQTGTSTSSPHQAETLESEPESKPNEFHVQLNSSISDHRDLEESSSISQDEHEHEHEAQGEQKEEKQQQQEKRESEAPADDHVNFDANLDLKNEIKPTDQSESVLVPTHQDQDTVPIEQERQNVSQISQPLPLPVDDNNLLQENEKYDQASIMDGFSIQQEQNLSPPRNVFKRPLPVKQEMVISYKDRRAHTCTLDLPPGLLAASTTDDSESTDETTMVTCRSQLSYDIDNLTIGTGQVTSSIAFFLNANKQELHNEGLSVADTTYCNDASTIHTNTNKNFSFSSSLHNLSLQNLFSVGDTTGLSVNDSTINNNNKNYSSSQNLYMFHSSFELSEDQEETESQTARGYSLASSKFTTDSPKILDLRERKRLIERSYEKKYNSFPALIEVEMSP